MCSNQHRTMAFPENKTLCVQTIQQKYNNLFKNMVLRQLDFHLQIMKLDPYLNTTLIQNNHRNKCKGLIYKHKMQYVSIY